MNKTFKTGININGHQMKLSIFKTNLLYNKWLACLSKTELKFLGKYSLQQILQYINLENYTNNLRLRRRRFDILKFQIESRVLEFKEHLLHYHLN